MKPRHWMKRGYERATIVILAHLTDLHVTKYGARMTDAQMGRYRLARGAGWESVWEDAGWRIDVRWALGRVRWRDAFRLVDSRERVHRSFKAKGGISYGQLVDGLKRLREIRLRTDALELARRFPGPQEVERLLAEDPENGNVRFCAVAHAVRKDAPDWLVLTGDLTDDGEGYELIKAGLSPFIQKRRFICIPGNHDVYPTPPVWNARRFRKSENQKRVLWENFAAGVGVPVNRPSVQSLGEGVLLAPLDSCHPSSVPGSSSGLVLKEQLQSVGRELEHYPGKTLRLACLHHSLLTPSRQGLGFSVYQPGMKARNSQKILKQLSGLGMAVVMSGHRHLGYKQQTRRGPLHLGAPSTTYGCRSGAKPFYWRLETLRTTLASIQQAPIPALASI
jgi:3',5'-cyclic AMP phosphodiesterase CpdA